MTMTFSTQPVLFTNVPVGAWFKQVRKQATYLKTDGWRARRVNSKREVRVPAGTVCYVEQAK